MTLTRITMMAITRRTWINPPMVVLVTSPSSHRTISITQMVHNILFAFQFAEMLVGRLFDGDVVDDLANPLGPFRQFTGAGFLVSRVDEAAQLDNAFECLDVHPIV